MVDGKKRGNDKPLTFRSGSLKALFGLAPHAKKCSVTASLVPRCAGRRLARPRLDWRRGHILVVIKI